MERAELTDWIERYERAWRTAGTEGIADLFAEGATYLTSPWRAPIVGLEALAAFWDAGRRGPDEAFTLTAEVVAVEGDTGVARVAVDYEATGNRWRDLWIVRLDADGRCSSFEEWPFAPDQPDGQE
ncbi:MAG TPA: nuclear transport factor 2 family protein [Iamia sp.]